MSSSTSNSDAGGRWWRLWMLAIVLAIVVIGSWECLLRHAEYLPELTDNRALWLSARQRLARTDPSVIAILGASRVQRAVDVAVLSEEWGRPVVQLAVEGSSGLPVLESLAVDPRFRGTVIFSIAPPFSFNQRLSKLDAGSQAAWVRAYLEQSSLDRLEQELRLGLQRLFAFRSAEASLSRLSHHLLEHRSYAKPNAKEITSDRFVSIFPERFDKVADPHNTVALYRRNTEPYSDHAFRKLTQYFEQLVQILNAKGSRVFVVRLPTTGAVLDYERIEFPRDRFWDRMKSDSSAHFIHFDDYPSLRRFVGVDGSHIDSSKAAAFTRRLARILQAHKI